ncbi:MAG: 16S rRNA (guanine(527)-N(7))-methyltransferase RsmG [Pseudomonadota bacterium]|nr:16S rRNA (guanine(527)-N(7))-methyltransferase RsmG [Pseudomonadota bacterium]
MLEKNYNVDKEKKRLLEKYVFLIKKNQENVSLIGKSTISDIWLRHIIDSLQIIKYLPKEEKNKFLIDVGTGAGLPGVVLAIMGRSDVLLCEKSPKKTNFLKVVLKECSLNAKIYNCRIEDIIMNNIAIIVSRAYASIKKLILTNIHLISKETILVIHKGKKHMKEIADAKKEFAFNFKKFDSITSNEGVILKIENIIRK